MGLCKKLIGRALLRCRDTEPECFGGYVLGGGKKRGVPIARVSGGGKQTFGHSQPSSNTPEGDLTRFNFAGATVKPHST